jgi:hypothetical protein
MAIKNTALYCGTTLLSLAAAAAVNPRDTDAQVLADPNYGPVPGQSPIFSNNEGDGPTFPANFRGPIMPTAEGEPDVDDVVWQNLLAAEWLIYEFYQQGTDTFNVSAFVDAGFPNTTYDAISTLRDNEAGHLRIFQNQISDKVVKPGACEYKFPWYDAESYLALTTVLEISSMAFLTGLVQTAQLPGSHAAMVAIAEVETRHETWSLLDIWHSDPFSGPSDTVFPYANQILGGTRAYIVPGSCPEENPLFPNPSPMLPHFAPARSTQSLQPGATVELTFPEEDHLPEFQDGQDYYAVFFHGPINMSVPLDVSGFPDTPLQVVVPDLEPKGVFIVVLADAAGAPTNESVVAGPSFFLMSPAELGLRLVQA